MDTLQWNHFEKKIYIKTDINALYRLWATEEGITSWFLKEAEFIKPDGDKRGASIFVEKGDRYTWYWHNWDGKAEGMITQANNKDFIEFTFEESMVAVSFEEKQQHVIVTLKQFEIPEDDKSKLRIHFGCSNGWTFWLTNLKAYLEHGILLNETEINLKQHDLADYIFVNM